MFFLPHDRGRRNDGPQLPRHRRLARLLFGCCALAVIATAFPWTSVEAPNLFGWLDGPIGAHTQPGFSCLLTCVLTALLLLGEGRDPAACESVRAACLALMGTAAAMLVLHFASGPLPLRGVESEFSVWFFAAGLGAAAGALAALQRLSPRARA